MATKKPTLFFGFVYNKSGGLIGANDRISYESITKKLIFVDRSNKKNKKQLHKKDEAKLKRTISDNGFFEVENFYPNIDGIVDAFEYTLIATRGGQIQATHWTGESKNTPEGLLKIASAIEQLASR